MRSFSFMTKHLQLGSGFEFTFVDTAFAPRTSAAASHPEILGWEYCAGKLSHPTFAESFPQLHLTLLCLPETSVQTAALVENIFKIATHKITGTSKHDCFFSDVFIDFPLMMAPLLQAVLKSFPHCVTVAESATVSSGAFSGKGLSAEEQLAQRPLCYLESLDSRRLFLTRLLEHRLVKLSDVHVYGGTDAQLQWRLLPQVQEVLGSCPSELLLPSGLLPFLEGRFFLAQHQLQSDFASFFTEPAELLFEKLQKGTPGSQVLVVADAPVLLALVKVAKTAKIKHEKGTPDHAVLQLATARRMREQKNKGPVELRALTPANNSEFARVPGFLSNDFLKQSAHSISNFLNPVELARQSLASAFQAAALKFEEWTKLKMNRAQERDYFKFAHRLAAEEGLLFPRTFDLLLAARAVVDSNFAFELLQLCRAFPTNAAAEATLPVLDVPFQELFQKTTTLSVRQFETLQRHKPRKTLRAIQAKKSNNPLAQPVTENKYADNSWVKSDHPYSCSFPDEDIFMEEFAFAYRKQAREMVRARETHLSELQSSLKDGLDLRETVRHWHSQKIIVREELNVGKADVGSIVFHFAEPGTEEKYSWQSFWLAEQHDSSNLMFYATPFQDSLIGPGIAKSEFGGFAVIPLPSYSENPWTDPYIRAQAQTPSEALLLAGALATDHRSVLYIDNHPPSRRIADLLKRSGKTIIHVRLAELPPEKIRRVKTFHILAEAGVREYAEKYIRKE